ncbi:hypothetical protein [Pseudomonas sp. AM4(2022)]|uniref:hypothetical protein n=1 Tax=Pseudomonas sp. AM4(2022) TaxID=2983408 RepID=UPI002E80D7A9|nr:hypothetical protein [Pseudomonas sp. AM4(2022)]
MTKYLTSKTESGAFATQVETSVSDEVKARQNAMMMECRAAALYRATTNAPYPIPF